MYPQSSLPGNGRRSARPMFSSKNNKAPKVKLIDPNKFINKAVTEYEEEVFIPKLYALDPHKLMRCIENRSMLAHAQMVLHASLARKASAVALDFGRVEFPHELSWAGAPF